MSRELDELDALLAPPAGGVSTADDGDELDQLLAQHPLTPKASGSGPSGSREPDELDQLLAHSDPRSAGNSVGNIDLRKPAPGTAVVTSGAITPIGVPASEYARLASTGTLKDRIQANLMIMQDPDLANAVAPIARRMQAPGTVATVANLFTGNLIAPLSDRAAQAATEHDLEAYGEGGRSPGDHANLFGAAAAVGDVAGNVAPVAAERVAATAVPRAVEAAAPEATTAARRILQSAKSGAKVNAAIGAGGTALFGDANGDHDIGAIAKAAAEQGVVGAAAGAGIGGLVEGAGIVGKGASALLKRELSDDPGISEALASETERRVAADRAAEQHPLTGLPGKRAYMRALPTAEADPDMSVVRFDINNFKAVNDTHGHQAGDAAIQDAGKVLSQAAAETGISRDVFHPSGDEFSALVPSEQARAFRDRAEELYGVRDHGAGVKTSLSGGIGSSDHVADTDAIARKAVQKADQGLPASRPTAGVVGHISEAQAADVALNHDNLANAAEGPVYTTPEGLQHLWDMHSDQLRPLGYNTPEEFARSVGQGFTDIRRGAGENSTSIILVKPTADGAHILHATLDEGVGPAAWEVGSGHAMRPRSLAQRELLSEPAHPGSGRPDQASTLPPDGESPVSLTGGSLAPESALTAQQQQSALRSISSKMGEAPTPETSAEPAPPSSDNLTESGAARHQVADPAAELEAAGSEIERHTERLRIAHAIGDKGVAASAAQDLAAANVRYDAARQAFAKATGTVPLLHQPRVVAEAPGTETSAVLGHTADGRSITATDIALDEKGEPRRIGTAGGSAMLLKTTADAEDHLRAVVRDIAERHDFTGAWDMSALSPAETQTLNEAQAAHAAATEANRTLVNADTDLPPNPAADDDEGIEYRHSVGGFVPKALEALKTGYRGAMVTPYAHIEQEAPALVDALHTAGAANAAAQHVSERRAAWVLDGLTKDQRALFGKQLVADNLEAEGKRKGETAAQMMATHRQASVDDLRDGLNGAADGLERKAARLPASDKSKYAIEAEAANLRARIAGAKKKSDLIDLADQHFAAPLDEISQRFYAHAADVRTDIPQDTELEPWFQTALAKHRAYVEPTMNAASVGAGVDPASFRQPASAYVKLVSEDRLTNHEIRRAMDAAQVSEPGQLKPRGRITRALIGEKPELRRLFPKGTEGLRQGPINPASPSTSADLLPPGRRGATRTGSARTAAGSAREYVTDYQRILQQDARDKITRSANNAVYDEVAKVGRPLAAGEEPALGKVAVSRQILDPLSGEPSVQRFEVTRKVANALKKFEHQQLPPEAGVQLWRKTTSTLTRAQISGMPVEATSHMNTLASIVASVPGEKDVAGKAMAAVPGLGAKAAAIREMTGIDFKDAKTRALESRLADIGALRIDEDRGGLVNTAHHALFGPEGVDVRGRLVLARKYLDRKPKATDGELREFVTGKLGNYVRANSGAAVNALQDVGVSAFARFQGARIPSSIRSTFGASGLPGTPVQRAIDAASTLYRGPVGYAIASDLANRAITGHGTLDNEPGHHGDVATGLYATPDGLKHMTEEEAAAYGSHARPLYIPMATLNPVLATGMRATGARGIALGNGNKGTRIADALRDVENTGLGVAGPAVRVLSAATTGRTPYLLSDGSMLPISKPEFDKGHEMHSRVMAAIKGANPALAATEFGGGADSRSLQGALSSDGKFGGGPQAIAAGVASFLLPRIASVGVGGADNEGSEESQAERDYRDVMASYKSELRRAPGPKSEDEIIARAIADAKSDGRFNPEAVRAELEKYVSVPEEKRERTYDRGARNFTKKKMNQEDQ